MRVIIMIIALIPAMMALGHDAYLFYMNQGGAVYQDGNIMRFFASIGYIWTTYHPELFKIVRESLDQEMWNHLSALLKQKAFFMGLAFAGVIYAIILAFWALGIGGKKQSGSLDNRAKKALNSYEKRHKSRKKAKL